MRSGITTGTCAAAATKAALLAWKGESPTIVDVTSPQGHLIKVEIATSQRLSTGGKASVIKDAGDDPDVTHGTTISAEIEINTANEIILQAGIGVGIVTKPGLSVAVGQPAINPGPRKMIMQAIQDALPAGHGVTVTISIPEGEKLAKRTLNSTLGIIGGLSIIGTTGIVEPMSEEAFKNSLSPQISMVRALGYDEVVFAPGKMGQDIAIKRYNLPTETVIQTSNFVGHMLESAVQYGIKQVLLFGHLGKLVKVAAGIFHTHNRVADARFETLAAYMASLGAPQQAIQEVLLCNTTEAAMPIIAQYQLNDVYRIIAERVSIRAERYVFGDLKVGTAMITLQGDLLAVDDTAREIGGKLGWNIK
jgi:cobalt-precorrin-5B (C1)-methyltransferase